MSERDDDTEVMLADARAESFGDSMRGAQEVIPAGLTMHNQMSPRQVADLFGTLTTAQPVIKDRDHKGLMLRLKALAGSFGDSYIYSWDVKDRNSKRADGKTTIEGPTIQLANDLAREFGNDALDIRLTDDGTHWTFYGRFIDLQTGYTLTRPFRQRKNAMQGKYEDDRKLDMAFQVGASKCLRNVTVNALRNYVEFMMEEAKRAQIQRFKDDPEKYIEAIDRGLAKFGISLQAAEAQVGRSKEHWVARDIAKIYNTLTAISEGMVDAREAFPQDGPSVDPETGEVKESESSARKGDEAARESDAEARAGERVSQAPTSPAQTEGEKPPKETKAEPKAEPKADAKKVEKTEAPATKKTPAKKPAALF